MPPCAPYPLLSPAGTPGKDVYAGCNIDYAGKSITPQTFSAVLAGNETVVAKQCAKAGPKDCRSGNKVLKSGPNDNVFGTCDTGKGKNQSIVSV